MSVRLGIRAAAVAALCVVCLGAFPGPASAGTTNESYLFSLINKGRQARGKKVLKEHAIILRETRAHSNDMAATNTLGHFGFSGRVSRIRAADGGINAGVCENVAYARGYASAQDALRVIYSGWRQSSGHYKCMFDKLGWSSESAAIGLTHSGSTWWATFIAGHDSNP
jgi:uncharacterized protein YkwD